MSIKIKLVNNTHEKSEESFFCPVCGYPTRTIEDFSLVKSEYKCCHQCYLTYAESRRKEWKNGWRPNKTDVRSYISIRRKLYKKNSKEK